MGDRQEGPLFTTSSGRRVSIRQAQRRFRQWRDQAGISSTAKPHALRHTFAQRLYRATSDLFLVQAALHHRSVTSTTVYARADDSRLRSTLARF